MIANSKFEMMHLLNNKGEIVAYLACYGCEIMYIMLGKQ